LIKHLPKGSIKVAESGVEPSRFSEVMQMGYDAVLVGTSLLKAKKGIESMLSDFEQAIASSSATVAR